jgi:hypothetical protein
MVNNDINNLLVRCSCGQEARILWVEAVGKYCASNLGWQYDERKGWTCGGIGHSMAKLGTMTKADYQKAMKRVEEGQPLGGD